MKAIAHKNSWSHLEHQGHQTPQADDARPYLAINLEGVLLREAHDIVEELDMMARIYAQQ